MYTLLIIDMQPQFSTSEKCLPEVLYLISKAKRDSANILNVEYKGDGLSWPSIRKELRFYKNSRTIKKWSDDGGPQVFATLEKMNWLDKPIFTCGVNSDCCVPDTLDGLIYCFDEYEIEKPMISVIQKACNSNWDELNITHGFTGYPKEVKMIKDKNLFTVDFDLKILKLSKTKK
jgi:nicotinamidase-related amidase